MCKGKEVFLFVYGTLKKGKKNYLGIERACVEDSIDGTMFSVKDIPFPFVQIGTGGVVNGEVHLISEEHLAFLDKVEGNGQMYYRKNVVTKGGRPCHVYDATKIMNFIRKSNKDFQIKVIENF